MAMKQFGFVETLFKSLPAGIARSASFRERYKVFALFKWIHHGWRTEEPHLILATLQDNLPYSETESLVQQAAAQVSRASLPPSLIFFMSDLFSPTRRVCRSSRPR